MKNTVKQELLSVNIYSFIDELRSTGCRICFVYPRHKDQAELAFDFESSQKIGGYATDTNYDVTILPGGVPRIHRTDRNVIFKYFRFMISGLSDDKIDELLDNNGSALKRLYKDSGIGGYYNFAYVDDNNRLNLVFDYCDIDGKIFGEKETELLTSCFSEI